MVVFNTTVSSLSPLLLFVPQALWSLSDNTSTNATSNTAVVSNSSQGRAMALLQFTGTGVWIYGNSSSTSLDNCVVVVDGKRDSCISELDPGDTTSMLLYNGISLSPGKHIIELVNLENPEGNIVALDHAKFESNISGANVSQTQVQATTLGGSYHGVWSNATQGSIANSPTSSMSYNFTGQTIALYGPTNISSSPFLVMVDGSDPTAVMPNARLSSPNASSASTTLLYFNNRLSAGPHTITVRNNPVSERDVLAVSHFEVTSVSGSTSTSNGSVSAALIVPPIGGAFLLLVGVTIFVYCRRRRRRLAKIRAMMSPHPFCDLVQLPHAPLPIAQPRERNRVPVSMCFNVANTGVDPEAGVQPSPPAIYASEGRARYKPPKQRVEATEGVVHIGETRNRPAGRQLHDQRSLAGLVPAAQTEHRAHQSAGGTTHDDARRKRKRRRKAVHTSLCVQLPRSSVQARATGVARRVVPENGRDESRARGDDGEGTRRRWRPLPIAPFADPGMALSAALTHERASGPRYKVYKVPVIEVPPPYDRGHVRL